MLTTEQTIMWMEKMSIKVQENKEYLTSLDQAIGDGDHGINLSRGFSEVVSKISATNYNSSSDVLKDVAMTLMSKVGGASGPLYGTAFLKLSMALNEKESTFETFTTGVDEALNGIIMRGKAQPGEKTMVDVWSPVVKLFKETNEFNSDKLKDVAREAAEATKDVKATKGRASYLGDRSIGHIDSGSMSSYYLFEALAEVLSEGAK
ncbi:dihydroxyacetone kinase subunit DhaL [Aquibacillus salsiterrae]